MDRYRFTDGVYAYFVTFNVKDILPTLLKENSFVSLLARALWQGFAGTSIIVAI